MIKETTFFFGKLGFFFSLKGNQGHVVSVGSRDSTLSLSESVVGVKWRRSRWKRYRRR
ncbi:unnamed protein product [Brassica oleracea]